MGMRVGLLQPVHLNTLVVEQWKEGETKPFNLATERSGMKVINNAVMGLGGWDLDNLGCYNSNGITGGVRLGQFLDIFV